MILSISRKKLFFFSAKKASTAINRPTEMEKVEKKYLPNIPPSLNRPKLIPVFLTKTSLKKEKTEIEAKPLSNIILDIKILVHWSIIIANNINKIV